MDDGLRTENFETNGSELSEPLIIHEHPRQSRTSFQVQPNRVYQKQATNPARCVQHLNQHFHQHVDLRGPNHQPPPTKHAQRLGRSAGALGV
jgi:hypothetical protein